jgi:hypothetical protein
MLTTLELAAAIADAVLAVADEPRDVPWRDAATQAVMQTLDRYQSWFCASYDGLDGSTRDARLGDAPDDRPLPRPRVIGAVEPPLPFE